MPNLFVASALSILCVILLPLVFNLLGWRQDA